MTTAQRTLRSIPERHPSVYAWFTDCDRGPVVTVARADHDYFGEFFSLRLDCVTVHLTREQLETLRGQIDTAIRAALDEEGR